MLVPWYVMSLIYPLQSNIILFALCRLGKYVNKTFTFSFFLFCSWKSLCLRFLFPEAIPPSLSTLALPTWARRLGMVKKASKVMIKGKYLPILENMCHCIYTANGNNSSTYNLIILYICVSCIQIKWIKIHIIPSQCKTKCILSGRRSCQNCHLHIWCGLGN